MRASWDNEDDDDEEEEEEEEDRWFSRGILYRCRREFSKGMERRSEQDKIRAEHVTSPGA